jgi:MFS transporter, ACS family, glucarate transporter
MDNGTSSVRWVILAMILGFSFVSYLERVNISIAAELMMPGLSLTKTEMGQVFSSFLIGYAIFQVPGGMLGDAIGPRLTLSVAAFCWGVTTVLTGFIPGIIVRGTGAVLLSLCILRFLLGSTEAVTYPVSARSVRNWVPANQRAMGNSFMVIGSPLGTAIAAPLVSWLMLRVGWRESFYITSIFAFLIAVFWYWYATDDPSQHADVSKSELALIRDKGELVSESQTARGQVWKLLSNRNVLFLSLSYICEGYVIFIFVFWLYIYLVEVRGFSILKGGVIASLPWLTAVAFVPLGGIVCDRLSAKKGRVAGARSIIMVGYGLSGALLFVSAASTNRTIAVATISLSLGFLLACDPAFWATATYLAGENAGTVSGIMNAAAIVGGVISTSLVPVLVKQFGWLTALGSGAAMAILCTLLWWTLGRESMSSEGAKAKLSRLST